MMTNIHGLLFDLATAMDTDAMELVIWVLIGAVVVMSFALSLALWKQAEYDRIYDEDNA
ncbi:hypothetical protein V5T82_15310 [Magnetovibrio sp. PR-2]|uniref:hypothetical protein n=1 Tax=Magnetovibrio sp. PR-2 TaxID=3120356 RepID=UPI002FCE2BFF